MNGSDRHPKAEVTGVGSGRSIDAVASILSVDRLNGAVAAIAAIDRDGLAGGSANDTGLSVVAAGDTVSLKRASVCSKSASRAR